MKANQQQPAEALQPPKCPHCKQLLPAVNFFNWIQPPYVVLEIHCPHCMVILHMEALMLAEMPGQSEPPKRPSLIS